MRDASKATWVANKLDLRGRNYRSGFDLGSNRWLTQFDCRCSASVLQKLFSQVVAMMKQALVCSLLLHTAVFKKNASDATSNCNGSYFMFRN
jgi:hypothetical protein